MTANILANRQKVKVVGEAGANVPVADGYVLTSQSEAFVIAGDDGTIRIDPTGSTAQPVTDNGSSLTVDNSGTFPVQVSSALPAGSNLIGSVRLTDGTDIADVLDLSNSNPLTVAIVDGSGDQITSFGGGTQYTEGNTDTSITGTAVMWEDSGDTLRSVSQATPLPVNIIAGSSSGVQYTEGDTDVSITGTALMLEGAGNTLVAAPGTAASGLLVDLGSNNDVVVSGTVAVSNASGGSAVNIQDGGNSITVDGTLGAAQSGIWAIRGQDGYGRELTALTGAPGGTETGLVVRNIPSGTQTITGTVTANAGTNLNTSLLALESGGNLAATATSLAILDDWDESDRAKVNPIVGQAGIQGGSGTVSANTQRVVLATDVGLPAGSNSIGILGSNSGVDIGDVTINNASGGSAVNIQDGGNSITVDGTVSAAQSGTWSVRTQDGYGNSLTALTGAPSGTETGLVVRNIPSGTQTISGAVTNTVLSVIGGGTEATAQRVTIASDSTGVLSVDDNGSSLTIDNATLSVLGGGTEATALRVTLASDSTGLISVDDNGGSLTVDGTVAATQSGTWSARIQDGYGLVLTGSSSTPIGTETALIVRNIPSGTQTISGAVTNSVLSVVGGGTEATAQRVTIASDSTGVLSVDDNGASLTVDNAALSVVGGGTEATALRVTIASDSTGLISIDDNGSSITVDGTVAATQSGAWSVRLTDGTDTADILDLANNNPLTVAIVDGSGDQITSFGGGTQYTEDAAAAANPVGTAPMLVRADSPATITNTDGDNVAQRGTNYGAAYVQVVSSAGAFVDTFGGGTQYTEGATDASITGTAMLIEGAGDTLVVAPGTAAGGLLVDLGSNNDVTASQTGTWTVRTQDGYGIALTALASTPTGTETGLVVRNIPNGTQTISGTVTANAGTNLNTSLLALESGGNLAGAATSLAILDDWDESDRAKVNPIVGQAGVAGGSGTVGATTQRVVLATDVALPAGTNAIGSVRITDGTDTADIFDLANSNPLTVAVVDASGDQITSFGGGTQYTEDAAAAANPVGTAPILVRADTPATVTNTDGDNVAQRGTNYGAAYVQVVSSAGAFVDTFGGGTQYTEGDADASITGTALMLEAAANTLVAAPGTAAGGMLVDLGSNNDVTVTGTVAATQSGTWSSRTLDGYGLVLTGLASTPTGTETGLVVRNIPSGTQTVSLSGSTNVAKLEDDPSAHQDAGIPAMAVRKATPANTSGSDNDYEMLQMSEGRLWARVALQDGYGLNLTGGTSAPTGTETALFVRNIPSGTQTISGAVTNTVLSVVGGGTEAAAQRVTIASDSTGVLSVDDNGDSLTIDNAALSVVGGGAEASALRVTVASDSTGVLSIDDNGGSITVDNGGTFAVQIAAAATSIAKTEDDPHSTGDVGALAMALRRNTASSTSGADNDYQPLITNTTGHLWVDASGQTLTTITGQTGVQGGSGTVSANTQRVVLATDVALPAGTNNIGNIDVLSVIPGTTATSLGKAEDAGHTTGDVGVMALAVRSDAGATGSPTVIADASLDYIPLATDSANRLYTNAAGSIAHDSPDSTSFPVKVGGQARTTNPTAVADADRVNFIADDLGRQVVVQGQVRDLMVHQTTTITNSTAETTILTAAASTFHDLVQLIITNQTATAVNVTIKDATAGTTRMIIALAASGGAVIPFTRPVTQAAVNGNWTATLSVNTVTVNIFAMAEKNV